MTECVTDSSQDTSISSQYHLLSQRYKQSVPLKTQHQHEKKVCSLYNLLEGILYIYNRLDCRGSRVMCRLARKSECI